CNAEIRLSDAACAGHSPVAARSHCSAVGMSAAARRTIAVSQAPTSAAVSGNLGEAAWVRSPAPSASETTTPAIVSPPDRVRRWAAADWRKLARARAPRLPHYTRAARL